MAKKNIKKQKNANVTEIKKEEATPQVVNTPAEEKTVEAPKEAPKEVSKETPKVDNPVEEKAVEKPIEAPKDEKKSAKKASKEKEVLLVPEEAENSKDIKKVINNIPIGSTGSSFDAKAMLAYTMNDRYKNNKELAERYPEFYQAMNRNIDVVVVLALVDLRNEIATRNSKGELKLTLEPDQVIQLQEAASLVGIELAPAKALPNKADGQMELNFTESKIPEALKENKEEEKEVELDPKKITSEEEVNNALSYLLKHGKNIIENIINTVEWYRVFRCMKEENADKKLELDNRSVEEWLTEIFERIPTTAIFNGYGSAMYNFTYVSGNPLKAHSITHSYATKAGWSEEQIASLVKLLISGKYHLKVKDAQTPADPKENKAINAIVGSLGVEFVDKLFKDLNAEDSSTKDEAKKTIDCVRNHYFKKETNVSLDELRLKVGQIINLYRDPMDRIAEYAFSCEQVETEKKN